MPMAASRGQESLSFLDREMPEAINVRMPECKKLPELSAEGFGGANPIQNIFSQ